MSDKFLNQIGLSYYHNRAKTLFENKIEKIKVNGQDQQIDNKEINLKVAQLSVQDEGISVISTEDDVVNFMPSENGLEYYADGMESVLEIASIEYVNENGGKIDKIKVNGTEQTITNKEVDIAVPTKVSELSNDEEFIKNTVNNLVNYYGKSESYSKAEVDEIVRTIETGGFVKVATLPTASADTMHKIYLVPRQTQESGNICDEYITIENEDGGTKTYSWDPIGSTAVNLDGYWNEENLVAITTAEIDELFA